jgi:hypothetical protein
MKLATPLAVRTDQSNLVTSKKPKLTWRVSNRPVNTDRTLRDAPSVSERWNEFESEKRGMLNCQQRKLKPGAATFVTAPDACLKSASAGRKG